MKHDVERTKTSKTYTVLLIILLLSAIVLIGGVCLYNRAQIATIRKAQEDGFVPKSKRDIARDEEIKNV